MKTLEQLFKELSYSQIDIKLEISSNGFNTEVGFVTEGYNEWGDKIHLSSDISESVEKALRSIREDLESKYTEGQ